MRQKPYRLAMLLLAALTVTPACTTTPTRANQDPDRRLDSLLVLYRDNVEEGTSCQEVWHGGHETIDCERILRQVEQLAFEFPEHRRIGMASALLNYQAGRPDKAQYHLDVLLARNAIHPEAAVLRSRIALEQGNTTLARRLIERQIRFTPDRAELYETLAAVHYLTGRYAAARAALGTAARFGAPSWRLAYHRGLLAEAEGRWAEAYQSYRQCLYLNPEYQPARVRLAGLPE